MLAGIFIYSLLNSVTHVLQTADQLPGALLPLHSLSLYHLNTELAHVVVTEEAGPPEEAVISEAGTLITLPVLMRGSQSSAVFMRTAGIWRVTAEHGTLVRPESQPALTPGTGHTWVGGECGQLGCVTTGTHRPATQYSLYN